MTNSTTARYIWVLVTGALASAILVVAIVDAFNGSVLGNRVVVYAAVALLSLAIRTPLVTSQSSRLVTSAGISSAMLTAFALSDVYSVSASVALIQASGIYLMLGIWLLMIDMIYPEIENDLALRGRRNAGV
jgi:hypothetical protein